MIGAPLISIITINYNNAEGLRRTIESAVGQQFNSFEYIVIDGGSNDGSVAVIDKHATNITYHISERDSGIYNAMNKGIKQAKGTYLLFINSGDCLNEPNSLQLVADTLTGEDIVYCDLLLQLSPTETRVKEYTNKLNFSYFMYESLPHPASFIKRELFDRLGLYDESFKIVSDWGFFLNAICKANVSYKHVSKVISTFYLDGISSTPENTKRIEQEKKAIIQKDFPMFTDIYDLVWENRGFDAYKSQFEHSRIIRILRKFGFFR